MDKIKKLPDSEFEIMKAVWHSDEPVTSPDLTDKLKTLRPDKDWKQQTIMTMLVRLEKKGFLRSEKISKERGYYAVISESEYMAVEAASLRQRFGSAKVTGFVKALCDDKELSDEDIADLRDWLDNM
ncbi:MAG: BlaI/MecI/CopY family transcriptional regulator [Clostridiales bacterium]|nr:BlaI/MecI/CopY family transcriptional regulator [Clostridiales bacterium]